MNEAYYERQLTQSIRALGAMCLKFVSPGNNGVPDRIILLPGGYAMFAELKQPGKKERARQDYVQRQLRALGFEVYSSVNSLEKIGMIVDRCKEVIGNAAL